MCTNFPRHKNWKNRPKSIHTVFFSPYKFCLLSGWLMSLLCACFMRWCDSFWFVHLYYWRFDGNFWLWLHLWWNWWLCQLTRDRRQVELLFFFHFCSRMQKSHLPCKKRHLQSLLYAWPSKDRSDLYTENSRLANWQIYFRYILDICQIQIYLIFICYTHKMWKSYVRMYALCLL